MSAVKSSDTQSSWRIQTYLVLQGHGPAKITKLCSLNFHVMLPNADKYKLILDNIG